MLKERLLDLFKGRTILGIVGMVLLASFFYASRSQNVATPVAPLRHPQPVSPAVSEAISLPKGTGKIAIVLDDWGYSPHPLSALKEIPRPLGVAVLPGLAYSSEIAQEAHRRGHEVILHLPLEARDPDEPKEAATITTSMSREEILRLFQRSLESVPFALGVSNHQGSKATADPLLMRVLLGEIQRRRLYFLDSLTTEDSVGQTVASDLKVRFIKRAVFLDNEKSPEKIWQRLIDLAHVASRQGSAIGIGHDHPVTLEVLKQAIPAMKKAGYRMVGASQLAEVP